ncbi:hypothetical protein AKJ64_01175 [candidate division MSBL1 archaeon SCGC-AAA259E17]|uniref:Uncharacterized protein n=1 Tax=candidate division MSBL1 archaeon SCGC-AAA259E17 TaxID=1698263 RepID=A0A133UG55_9EURY|nr:hypothetical protein AKJ64_01175 [candidate division MSBL1 archaeon SCGC-AAA259E17]
MRRFGKMGRSLEKEKKRFGVLILSAVIVAICVSFLPMLASRNYYLFLLLDFGIVCGAILLAFLQLVRPFILEKEYMCNLIFDYSKERFLIVGDEINYSFYANDIITKSEGKFVSEEEVESAEDIDLRHIGGKVEDLLLALLLRWLESIHQTEIPVSHASAGTLSPLPTKYLKRPPASMQKLETERVSWRYQGSENPFINSLLGEVPLPEGTNFDLTDEAIRLKHKRFELRIEPRFVRVSSISALSEPYFRKISKMKGLSDIDIEPVEFHSIIKLSGNVGRFGKDVHIQFLKEMAKDLENFIHWDKVVE